MVSLVMELPWCWFGAATERGRLIRTYLAGSRSQLEWLVITGSSGSAEDEELLQRLQAEVRAYTRGVPARFEGYHLEWGHCSDLSRRVWCRTQTIPWGSVRSYKWVAQGAGTRGYRAVGQIMGRNPFPLIVPCHRVVRHDGRLGGFGAGGDLKVHLLEHEGTRIKSGRVAGPAKFRRER